MTDQHTGQDTNRLKHQIKARIPFKAVGLSDPTITALLIYGIDHPERLLFIDPREIRCIPGVGDICMKDILRYRARFSR